MLHTRTLHAPVSREVGETQAQPANPLCPFFLGARVFPPWWRFWRWQVSLLRKAVVFALAELFDCPLHVPV